MTSSKLAGLLLLASTGSPSSCATAASVSVAEPRSWPEWQRPVTVAIDASMPAECVEAAWAGVEWWTDRGVDFLVPALVPPTHPAALGVPRAGEIGVSSSPLTPPAVGLTEWFARGGKAMHDAYITLDHARGGCTWQVAAHELGHALGLPDVYGRADQRNVMFGVTLRLPDMDVTARQLEQVR